MMLEFRSATTNDLDEVSAIDSVGTTERHAQIGSWIAAGECHVALRDARITGYAALTRTFFGRPFLEMLMVVPTARRSGIGFALVRHCISLLSPGDGLWSSTNQSNLPMQALFVRLGFVRSGIVENLDPGDPELIYLLRR